MRKFKFNNEGFSLIELVIVIGVLAILSAVSLPAFTCIIRKAKATAALNAIASVRKECIAKELNEKNPLFNNSNLNGYRILSSNNSSECNPSTQRIIASPDNNNDELPSFIYATDTEILEYSFKGITGTDVDRCLSFICDRVFNESKSNNAALQASLEANAFVIADTYVERDCSAYVLVNGPTWEDAKNNARALGGDLASVNDKNEHGWFAKEFAKDKYGYDGDTNPGDPSNWTNLWIGGEYNTQTGEWGWSSGQGFGEDGFEIIGENDPGLGTGRGTDSLDPSVQSKMLAHFNHNKNENQHTRHGEGEGSYYVAATIGSSNNTRGIAEINTCN